MRHEEYLDCLKSKMLRRYRALKCHTFLQDGAPCHRHRDVTQWLDEKRIKRIVWPGNSPDLNPIKNIWAIIKRRLKNKDCSSREKVISEFTKEWRKLDWNLLRDCARSMPRRLQEVLERDGGSTKY